MKITIECLNGPMDGEKKEFVDKEIITIGRLPDRDFCLVNQRDRYLSRKHATIILENGKYFVIDDSTNGTWINENRINKGEKVELPKECILKLAYIPGVHYGTHLKIRIEDSGGIKSPEEKVEEIMHRFYKALLEAKKELDSKQWNNLCKELINLMERVKSVKNIKELNDILKGMANTIDTYKSPDIPQEPWDISVEDYNNIIKSVDVEDYKNFNIIKNRIFSSGIFNKIKKELKKK